jgi:DNA-binding XRE family transcriptional regulator
MGVVISFRRRRHARALALPIAASDANVTCPQPSSSAKRTIGSQRLAGIPRSRHTLTVGAAKPRADATLPVPPKSSMTESHVMDANLICDLQICQGFADRKATDGGGCGEITLMARTRIQLINETAARLKTTRLALNHKKQNEFAQILGVDKSSYNLMETGKRPVTLDVGLALYVKFGISLDWLFLGNAAQLPSHLITKLVSGSSRRRIPA